MRNDAVLSGIASCALIVASALADDGAKNPPAAPAPAKAPEKAPEQAPEQAPEVAPALGKSDRLLNQIAEIRNEWTKTRSADAPPVESAEDRGREQVGRLIYSKVTLEFEEVPLRDALRALRRELGLNMTVFLLDLSGKSQRPGFDGDQPVSLALRAVDGRTALEALTAFAGKEVTWQIHNGVIEVGPRPHLARQDAREIRVYETADLAIDPPDWELGKTIQRRNSDEVIGELVKMIVTHCEPDAFLPAPATRIDEETGRVVPRQHTTPPGERKEEGPRRRNPNTGATANFKPEEAQVFVNGRWASIQMKDNNLAVLAPDFVHRAINGYPSPIPPPAAE
jgi:hypothetical protein